MTALTLTFFFAVAGSLLAGVYIGRRWERPPVRIVVTDRPDDYHACIEGEPGRWGVAAVYLALLCALAHARLGCGVWLFQTRVIFLLARLLERLAGDRMRAAKLRYGADADRSDALTDRSDPKGGTPRDT